MCVCVCVTVACVHTRACMHKYLPFLVSMEREKQVKYAAPYPSPLTVCSSCVVLHPLQRIFQQFQNLGEFCFFWCGAKQARCKKLLAEVCVCEEERLVKKKKRKECYIVGRFPAPHPSLPFETTLVSPARLFRSSEHKFLFWGFWGFLVSF